MKKSLLDCGIPLITESSSHVRSVCIGVWVRAGTRHEKSDESGVCHFIEHMLFKGTKNRSSLDIAKEIDLAGGEGNAFTSRESTCFYISLLGKDTRTAVELLSDVLINSKFDSTELDHERGVILQEIAMVDDSPEELVQDRLFEHIFRSNPLGAPILGTPKAVSKITREKLVSFFRKHYYPGNMLITAAGRLDHTELRDLFNKALADFRDSRRKPSSEVHKRAVYKQFIGVERRETEQIHAALAYPGLSQTDRRRFALLVLSGFIGGGMSSRLFQTIREQKGLAYNVYSSVVAHADSGLFTLYFGTTRQNFDSCMQIIGEEIKRLKKDRISREDIEIIKRGMKNTLLIQSDDLESKMNFLARGEMVHGRQIKVAEVLNGIGRVTPTDVREIARDILDRKRISALLIGEIENRVLRSKINRL